MIAKNSKKLNCSFLLTGGLFLCIPLQYIGISIDALSISNSFYFSIGLDLLEGVGGIRYAKDVYFVLFGLIWPFMIYSVEIRIYYILISMLFLLGLLGHAVDASLSHILAGLRWLVILHASFGVYFIIKRLINHDIKYLRLIVNLQLIILYVSFYFAFFQWKEMAYSLASGVRLNSLYYNSGVFGFFLSGISLLLFFIKFHNKSIKLLNLSAIFFLSLVSGTRSAMITTGIILLCSFILSERKHVKKSTYIYLFITALLLIPFLVISSGIVAGRGDLIDNFFDYGGRWSIYLASVGLFESDGFFTILFGFGLGRGTNTSVIQDLQGAVILDSSFLVWLHQFGFSGLFLCLFVLWITFLKIINTHKDGFIYKASIIFILILINSLNQNIFESHYFSIILGLILAVFLSKNGALTYKYKILNL